MTASPAEILAATRAQKHNEEIIRREAPLVRLWDAEWNIQHVLGSEYAAKFSWVSNDTGPGQMEIPFTSAAAQWIYDYQGRLDRSEGRTVGITVDYCGARWSGILDKFSVEQKDDGDIVLVIDWVHDYEHLKWYTVVSNPFLPSAFQAPRAWVLPGPVSWVLRLTLFLQIWREHNPFITWPDDPLDINNWATMGLDMSNWHIVVKPKSFMQAMQDGEIWTVASSRWSNFHDMAHYILEDSEISMVVRRYLPGDPPPWEGANLRYGTLVVDFEDKSGIYIGTSHGGSVFDGLARTTVEFADDFIDSTLDVVSDADTPGEYFTIGKRFTDPVKPYVIFYEGETSPVQTSSWIYSPTKGVQVEVGGHSMPGVVCAPRVTPGGRGPHRHPKKRMKRSRPRYKQSGTSSVALCRSAVWAAPSTHCCNRCTRTPSWRGSPTSPTNGPTTPAGTACTPTSKTGQVRRTPSPH